MAIIVLNNYFEAYARMAAEGYPHKLAGRGDKVEMTNFVNDIILQRLNPRPSDSLLDVGCGDGLLLRKCIDRVSSAVGTVATLEEAECVKKVLPSEVVVAQINRLQFDGERIDKVVCNGVLFLVETETEVKQGLLEIHRVTKPGGMVWIGEIPDINEFSNSYRGKSIFGLLLFLLRRHSVRAFLGMCRRLIRCALGLEDVVLHNFGHYFASPSEFVSLAKGCGLHLKEFFRHQDGDGKYSATRYDYIFVRPYQ